MKEEAIPVDTRKLADRKNCGACRQCKRASFDKVNKPVEPFGTSALYQAEAVIYYWYVMQTARRA